MVNERFIVPILPLKFGSVLEVKMSALFSSLHKLESGKGI